MHVWKDIVKLVVALTVTFAAGYAGSLYTAPSTDGAWYDALRKPTFNPPSWVFAPVWTLLYTMMAVAAFLVWRSRIRSRWKPLALGAYTVQLGLNFLWSVLFFGLQQPYWALLELLVLWVMIVITMALFRKFSLAAALLLVPYLAWVTFAGVLNAEIWRLNR